MSKIQCAARVWSSGHWHTRPCGIGATVEENGNWWCKAHAPSYVVARATVRHAEWDRKVAREDRKRKRGKAVLLLMESAILVSLDDLPDWAKPHVVDYLKNQETD